MDAFTEKILARARERQRMIHDYPSESSRVTPLRENNQIATSEPNLTSVQPIPPREVCSETNIPSRVSQMTGSPGQQQTKTLNIQRDDFNMEIKVNSAENVRLEVQIEERNDYGNQGSQEQVGLREESKNRLKRLGKLYAGGEEADISSPIHRTEAKFYQSMEDDKEKENHQIRKENKSKKGLSRLADLADTINQWEDDLSHPTRPSQKTTTSPKKSWKPPAPQPPSEKQVFSPQNTPTKPLKPKAPSPPIDKQPSPKKALFQSQATSPSNKKEIKNDCASPKKEVSRTPNQMALSPKKVLQSDGPSTPSKHINWDKKVLDTLESQGFTRTQSSSRLVYSYNSQEPTENKSHLTQAHLQIKNDTIPEEKTPENSEPIKEQPKKPQTPESPSKRHFKSGAIANRAAMFEQKASESAVVKPTKDPALLTLAERKALFEKNKGEALVPKAAFGMSAPVKVDTTMKACESKLIGASKGKETIVQAHRNLFEPTNNDNPPRNQPGAESHAPKAAKYPAPPPPLPELKIVTPPSPKIVRNAKTVVPTVAIVHQGGGIASKMAALLENKNKSTISEEQIFNKMKGERQKELDMLLNRFNKNKIPNEEDEIQQVYSDQENDSDYDEDEVNERTAMIKEKPAVVVQGRNDPRKSGEKRKSGNRLSTDTDSPSVVSVLEEVKRIKVSPPKAGRLYPNLSDIEATTTDQDTRTPTPNEENSDEDNCYDSDDPNTSFGRDVLQAVCNNVTPTRKVVTYKDNFSGSSENSSIMDELDEILEEMEDDSSTGPTPPKQGRHQSPKYSKPQPSNSFHYKSFNSSSPKSNNFQSPKKSGISPRQSAELPLVVDGDHVMTLTHTVSFYRKQQQNEVQTPIRQIVRQPPLIEESDEETGQIPHEVVRVKIEQLQEEVNKQQNIISQTSQALNLCNNTPEFSGSTEQVEAERVLLVATHRRQAALHELQRLKVEGTMRPLSKHSQNVPLEKGTLTISNIVLPLKQKYVTALAAAGGKGHHVVCLIKCGEQVVPTKLVSTVANNSKNPDCDLYVPGSVVLNDIYSDFAVTFEVYCLQAQEECLPHEVKYHINKKSSKGLVTPKKSKQESRLARPPKESPGGPQAIRTSSFALMGYVVFSVQAINKKMWSLNNTPPMSPLEGGVEMKINCKLAVSVEHRAFLTMFEDVSGFGAWHRRWCLLKGDTLSYWKYPEDEKKMPPIDTIDLNNCTTKQVGPVSREICARLHTFLLERERPAQPQDKDTLVVVRKGDKTIIRHLLSADTKEERIEWCLKLNAALTALQMWGKTQQ